MASDLNTPAELADKPPTITPSRSPTEKFIRFAVTGAGLLGLTVGVNFLLVESCGLAKPLAYFSVIVGQLILGYYLNRYAVFEKNSANTRRIFVRYALFMGGLRVLDWGAYVLLVECFSMPYTPTIIVNRVVLFALKFIGYQQVFEEAKPTPAGDPRDAA